MRVIGTAGHVDHGKSTLVRRLTGIDPDRLAEEKARQMTIDLGFAWLTLADGETVGIVDAPGHRDFIENMLAGVGGIGAVLLVIAADEGVMPQTREHVAIVDLLGIRHGVVALTKADLADDEWLALVEQEARDALRGTTLADAPIVPVSAQTGSGLTRLVERLSDVLAGIPAQPDLNTPRLPIDRAFTMSGFGTVVTGTLTGGCLRAGDEVEIQPAGLRGRIRGLQSYRQAVETAQPGSRVAVNVAGIDRQALARGQVVARPGQMQPTTLADARLRTLPGASRPLKHNAEVKVFAGTAETTARARLLESEMLPPGEEGWVQLRLDAPLALARGDRFIVRFPSPAETIGGGVIVNPHPERRWRRFQPDVLGMLERRLLGSPAERVAQAAGGLEPVSADAMRKETGLGGDFGQALEDALREGLLVALGDGLYLAAEAHARTMRRIIGELEAYHRAEPLRKGMPREELRSRIGIRNATLTLLLNGQDEVITEGNLARLATHRIRFSETQQQEIARLMAAMNAAPYSPPSYAEAAQMAGEDALRALIDLGDIVQVQADVIFTRQAYEALVEGALALIDEQGLVLASGLRDRFGTSRKYAIGLLEHLDGIGVTKRVGDARVRAKQDSTQRRKDAKAQRQ